MSRGAARDVRIEVAPGSIGVKFDPDYNGNAAVIKRFIATERARQSTETTCITGVGADRNQRSER